MTRPTQSRQTIDFMVGIPTSTAPPHPKQPQAIIPFDAARFATLMSTRKLELGQPLVSRATTRSTNDDLLDIAATGAPHGTVVQADFQTHGRGRHGRRWSSPRPAENLLFSVLLRPDSEFGKISGITLAIGLAVRQAVQPLVDAPVLVKWTNDIYVRERKLAGILVETRFRGNFPTAIVVGVGINVHARQFEDEVAQLATSLDLLGAKPVRLEDLLADVLEQIALQTARWKSRGVSGILEEWRKYDALAGRQIKWDGRHGIARGIDSDGALLVETHADGPLERVTRAGITLLPATADGEVEERHTEFGGLSDG